MKSPSMTLQNMEADIRTTLEKLIQDVVLYRQMGGQAHPKLSAALAEAHAYTFIDLKEVLHTCQIDREET